MEINRLNHWAGLAANICVIAGIAFLALELNQNSRMTASQTRADLTQTVLTLIEMERHPILLEAYDRIAKGEELDSVHEALLDNMANANIRHWENTYYQYQNGLFDEYEFEADFEVWREEFRSPIYQKHWINRRHTYSQGFREVVDELVSP
jgi:hypothetical protein